MITIKFNSQGAAEKFKKMKTAMADMSDPLKRSGEEIGKLYGEKNFERQGRALGRAWSPLAASTIKARQKRQGHYKKTPITTSKILVWTGELKNAFKKTVTKTRLVVENTSKYFGPNQSKRTMIKATTEVLDIASKNMINFLRKIIS